MGLRATLTAKIDARRSATVADAQSPSPQPHTAPTVAEFGTNPGQLGQHPSQGTGAPQRTPPQSGRSRSDLSRAESTRRQSIEQQQPLVLDPDLAQMFAEMLAQDLPTGALPLRIVASDCTVYVKEKTDALLATFPTSENPHPENEYLQKPSVAQLSQALSTAEPGDAQVRAHIFACIKDILGGDPLVMHRLAKSLGVEDLPTRKPGTVAKLALGNKAAKDADFARREHNLKEGLVDKLLELRSISVTLADGMEEEQAQGRARSEKILSVICKKGPVQLNHILLNFSQGSRGPDVLGVLEAATGQVLTHHERIEAVCCAERKLSIDTVTILIAARNRSSGRTSLAFLAGMGIYPVVISIGLGAAAVAGTIGTGLAMSATFGAAVVPLAAGFAITKKAPALHTKRYQHKLHNDTLNVPRNEKFLNGQNRGNLLSVLHTHQDRIVRGENVYVDVKDRHTALRIPEVSYAKFKKNLRRFMDPLPEGLAYIGAADRKYIHEVFSILTKAQRNGLLPLGCYTDRAPHFMAKTEQIIRHLAATAQHEHVHKVPKEHSQMAEFAHIAEGSCGTCSDHAGLALTKLYVRTVFDTTLQTNLGPQQFLENILQQTKHFGVMSDVEKYLPYVRSGEPAENSVKANMMAKDRYGLVSPFNGVEDFNYAAPSRIDAAQLDQVIADSSGTPAKFIDMLTSNADFLSFMRTHHGNKLRTVRVEDGLLSVQWRQRLDELDAKGYAELTTEDGEEMLALTHKIAQHNASPMAKALPMVLAEYGMRLEDYLPRVVAGQAGPSGS
jgi:hypothetical protein